MIGYKLVRLEKNGKDWLRKSYLMEAYGVYYVPDRWVRPQTSCGPLTVFRTLNDAHRFIRWNPIRIPVELWKVEYEPEIKIRKVWIPGVDTPIEHLEMGTVLARSVRLVECLERMQLYDEADL